MKKREEEEASIPPGTRLMGEDERIQTLEELNNTKKELNNILERMPIANNTLSLQRRRKEYEEKLFKIERAIETFSKKTVYIGL